MPKLRRMDSSGDSVLEWTREKDEVEVAREFNRLVEQGALAYRVDSPGKGSKLTKFDPQAEEIVFHGPIAGG